MFLGIFPHLQIHMTVPLLWILNKLNIVGYCRIVTMTIAVKHICYLLLYKFVQRVDLSLIAYDCRCQPTLAPEQCTA